MAVRVGINGFGRIGLLVMRAAIEAGRDAYLAGRIPKKLYATASSPETGVIAPKG